MTPFRAKLSASSQPITEIVAAEAWIIIAWCRR